MFSRIIAVIDNDVNRVPLPAEACTAIAEENDPYEGIACHDCGEGMPWCASCLAEREHRDQSLVQIAGRRFTPAEILEAALFAAWEYLVAEDEYLCDTSDFPEESHRDLTAKLQEIAP